MIRSHESIFDPIWKGRVNERSTGHKVKPENDEQTIQQNQSSVKGSGRELENTGWNLEGGRKGIENEKMGYRG